MRKGANGDFSVEHEDNFVTYETKERRTRPVMSKFERAKILALRAEQLDRGTPAMVEKLDGDDPLATAEREFAAGRIPFIIRRYLPNGTAEDWKLDELGRCDRRLSHCQK